MDTFYVIVDYTGMPVKFKLVGDAYILKYTKIENVERDYVYAEAVERLNSITDLIKSDTKTCSKNVVLPLRIVGAKKRITLFEL